MANEMENNPQFNVSMFKAFVDVSLPPLLLSFSRNRL